ncbi:hypothetical protein TKK_0013910 [Trichogramma kaykai]
MANMLKRAEDEASKYGLLFNPSKGLAMSFLIAGKSKKVCHRTHGGRILRHDAICRIAMSSLRQAGWRTRENSHFHTRSRLRKPDIVADKEGVVKVVDGQIVSAATPLDDSHNKKVAKYDTPDLKQLIATEIGTDVSNVNVTFITVSWRGIWSSRSTADLCDLGLKGILNGITTRALQGSHTNWSGWNKMTNIIHQGLRTRAGIG